MLNAGELDQRVTIEQMVVARDSQTGAEVRSWLATATVWARVRESSTSIEADRDEGDPVAAYARPSKVVMRWRAGIARETHRLKIGSRVFRIIGAAELGRRHGLELACAEWSHED